MRKGFLRFIEDLWKEKGDLRTLWRGFRDGARTPWEWYAGVFRRTLPALKPTAILMAVALTAAVIVGLRLAPEYPLPLDAEHLESLPQTLVTQFEHFGLMSAGGWWWILRTNLSAVALATVLGMFSFGVAAVILLMAPVAIVGYLAGSLALAGQNAPLYILALVVPHGTLEVPAALLAGAAVVRLGLAGVSLPRGTSLGESWLTSLAEWARVFVGLAVRKAWVAGLLYVAILLGSLAVTAWPIYFGPQVFAFNHFLGYFPGPLYDREPASKFAMLLSQNDPKCDDCQVDKECYAICFCECAIPASPEWQQVEQIPG